jgi:rhodanese-related sulfurtransferase
MALAAAKRQDFASLTEPDVAALLEDAVYGGKFDPNDLQDGSLKSALQKLLSARNLSPSRAYAELDNLQVVDARSVKQRVKLPNAREVDLARELAKEYPVLPVAKKNVPTLLYCENGNASREAARSFRSRGYQVRVLDGGFEAWIAAGLPTAESV